MKQLVLDLDLGAVHNGMFWCCCPHMSMEHSLVWQPPNQKRGKCVYCGKEYVFENAYGREGDKND